MRDLSIRESYLNGASAAYPAGVEDVVGKEAKKEIRGGRGHHDARSWRAPWRCRRERRSTSRRRTRG